MELDRQGRFIIGQELIDFGKLRDEVVMVGAGDHFEVWNVNLWREQIERIEKEYGRVP